MSYESDVEAENARLRLELEQAEAHANAYQRAMRQESDRLVQQARDRETSAVNMRDGLQVLLDRANELRQSADDGLAVALRERDGWRAKAEQLASDLGMANNRAHDAGLERDEARRDAEHRTILATTMLKVLGKPRR